MTIQEANTRLLFQLYNHYGDREAANIADLVMEKITGWKKIDRIVHKHVKFSEPMEEFYDYYVAELMKLRPVQYVLSEAWFHDLKFFVNENVLIPRPETEELVEWMLQTIKTSGNFHSSVIDIGTGSGCIPVVIKKKSPGTKVLACDISESALAVAAHNAKHHSADVTFLQLDILNRQAWAGLQQFNYIISNPPYIPLNEKDNMEKHVVQYEPHLALFVPENDPLVFYRAIAEFAEQMLLPGGNVFLEIHEDNSTLTAALFDQKSFETEIKQDMQGKDRMLKAWRN
jgi:release factor glutamine methyltransferase